MSNIFYDLRNLPSFIFGRGKDKYTQTNFGGIIQWYTGKGEDWVDTLDSQKFHLYNTTPQLRAVIDTRAVMESAGEWKHYKLNTKGEKELVEKSEIVTLLENPNFAQNGNEFICQTSIAKSIYGNCFIFKRMALGQVGALWCLPSDGMIIDRTGKLYKQVDIKGAISKYRLEKDDMKEVFDPLEIIHLKDVNPNDPLKGLSKIESLKMPISNVRGAYGFRNRIISANAMLGILSTDRAGEMGVGGLDKDEQKRLDQGFQSRWGMQEGKGDIMQTEASVKWSPMSYPTKDLMLFEEIDEDFKTIIDAYGLNVNIFSISKQSTYENIQHGFRLAYTNTIIPEAEQKAIAMTKAFNLDVRGEWLELCYDHLSILKTDQSEVMKRNAESIEIMLRAGMEPDRVGEILDIDLGTVTKVQVEQKPKAGI